MMNSTSSSPIVIYMLIFDLLSSVCFIMCECMSDLLRLAILMLHVYAHVSKFRFEQLVLWVVCFHWWDFCWLFLVHVLFSKYMDVFVHCLFLHVKTFLILNWVLKEIAVCNVPDCSSPVWNCAVVYSRGFF